MRLIIESTVVGLITVVFGSIVGFVVGKLISSDLPSVCKEWNKNHVMEISLFLTGFMIHFVLEITGGNKWYCKNGLVSTK